MKILFIAPRYSGGIGGHAARVAEKLQEHGFDIKLMHIPHIPIKKLKNPSFAVLSSLKALIGREKYDIVHAFNVPSAFAMQYTNARKKVVVVRKTTDRPEIVSAGYSEIAGISYKSILKSIKKNSKNSKIPNKKSPYGNGNSAKTIIQQLKKNL